MKIGAKVKELRVQKGLTQEELADRTELSKGFISQLERDLTSPSIATLMDILQALGTDLKDFFNEEPEEQIVFKESDYFEKLDEAIRKNIPSGMKVHEGRIVRFPELMELKCYRELKDTKRLERSIGTLGGGNHFIEIDSDDEGNKYLVIHTGSRNLGTQVAEHYQSLAYELMCGKDKLFRQQNELIARYKAEGRRSEIQAAIKELRSSFQAHECFTPRELCYLTGEYREMYLHDMRICQEFASLNRVTIAGLILSAAFGMELSDCQRFETIHNYIDHESNIVRKGAVSAKKGEKLLIPINMRDGSLICIGKGNPEWNCSAPHGAGRMFSRNAAKEKFTLDEFQNSMEGIYSTSIHLSTITPTAEIVSIIKPVYNFKAGD